MNSRNIADTVMQTPDEERMVREATTMEKWGPTAQQMKAISDLTYQRASCVLVMDALMRRLSEPGKYWRHVYKALLVIDYALKNGSPEVAEYCRRHVIEIQTLQRYQHIDEDNKDQGINVRERAKLVLELVNDRHKLADERKRADASRNKYVGVSSDGASYASYARGGRASSSSASRYGGVAYNDPLPQDRDDPRDEADSRWGMAGDMDTEDLPAPEPAPAAPAAAPAPAAQNLFDTEFSEPVAATSTTTTAAPAPAPAASATSLFDALDMVPASSQPQQQPQQTSFFAAPAPAQPMAQAQPSTSFFAAPQQSAPAPAPKSDPMSFFDMAPAATATTTTTSSNTMAFSSFQSSTPMSTTSSSSSSAFGFTSAAPAATTAAPASAQKPAPAKNDPWGGLVNLDSLSSTSSSASSASSQTSKVPMAAMASTGTTGPAMRPMGAASVGGVMQPTPATTTMGFTGAAPMGGTTLQPTRGPNYDALKQPQYNPYMMQQQQQQQMLRMQQMQQMQMQQRYTGNGSAF